MRWLTLTVFLKAYAADFTQLMIQMLREYRLSASAIISLPDYESKRAEAGRSLSGLIAYIEYILYQIRRIVDSIKENSTVVEKIKGWLDQNYRNTVERRDLEYLVYLSGDYVTKLFKKVCGMTITDYIINLRLGEAKALLRSTDLSINEVAARVGYDNYAYFSRLFRKRVGCSPKDYRSRRTVKLWAD